MTNETFQLPSARQISHGQHPFLRFLVVGAVNTGFGYGVFFAGLLAGLGPSFALALQFGMGIPFNYLLHGRYVFGVRGVGRLPIYAGAYLGLYAVNLAVLATLDDYVSPAFAQGLLVLPMAFLSFIVLSHLLR